MFAHELSGCRFEPSCSNLKLDFAPASSEGFLDIQATIECGLTLECVRDMTRTYRQMQRRDRYSEHSSVTWVFQPNGSVFLYELNGYGFESSCNYLHFKFRACFEQ